MKIFMPKPPPTSGVTTRKASSGSRKRCSANCKRSECPPWLAVVSVKRLPSHSPTAVRASIEATISRLFSIRNLSDFGAWRSAASVLLWSPSRHRNDVFAGASGQICWADSECARAVSTTAGRSLYSTRIASAPSLAAASVSPTTNATGWPA